MDIYSHLNVSDPIHMDFCGACLDTGHNRHDIYHIETDSKKLCVMPPLLCQEEVRASSPFRFTSVQMRITVTAMDVAAGVSGMCTKVVTSSR